MGLNMWGGEKTNMFILHTLVQAPILSICMPPDLRQIRCVWNIPHVSLDADTLYLRALNAVQAGWPILTISTSRQITLLQA